MTTDDEPRDRPARRVGGAAGAGIVFLAAGALGLVGLPLILDLTGPLRTRVLGFTGVSVALGTAFLIAGLRSRSR